MSFPRLPPYPAPLRPAPPRGRYSGEVGSAPTLVLGSGSEQQPRAASSVRPLDAGCGSAMAAVLFHRLRSLKQDSHPHSSRPGAAFNSRRREGAAERAVADFQPIAARRASWLSVDWVPVNQPLRPQDSAPRLQVPRCLALDGVGEIPKKSCRVESVISQYCSLILLAFNC